MAPLAEDIRVFAPSTPLDFCAKFYTGDAFPVPLTSRITLPNCLLKSSFSTSCVSSTSPHIPVCHRTSRLQASAACSMPNLLSPLLSLSTVISSTLLGVSPPSMKCSLHSHKNLAPTHRLLPASTALSNPTNSQAGSPAIHPLITARVAAGCDFGRMDPSSKVGLSSTPGQTLCVRYERIGFATLICKLRSDSFRAPSGPSEELVGGGAQQSNVSVSR